MEQTAVTGPLIRLSTPSSLRNCDHSFIAPRW